MNKINRPILLKDLGMRYPTENSREKKRYGLYQCPYCEKEFEAIINKNRKSCGCYNPRLEHSLTGHRMYKTWVNMIHRCSDSNFKQYKDYGGRGIKVCDEWKDIRNFIDWVENSSNWEEGLTLDRINTNGNYSPDNCTFSDRNIQSINQRMQNNNTSGFTGVDWDKRYSKWRARIQIYGKCKYIGYFYNIEDAVKARDNYIIDNNLPHPLSTNNNLSKL